MSGLSNYSRFAAALALAMSTPAAATFAAAGKARRFSRRFGSKTSPPRGRTHDPVTGVRLTVKYPANGSRP